MESCFRPPYCSGALFPLGKVSVANVRISCLAVGDCLRKLFRRLKLLRGIVCGREIILGECYQAEWCQTKLIEEIVWRVEIVRGECFSAGNVLEDCFWPLNCFGRYVLRGGLTAVVVRENCLASGNC